MTSDSIYFNALSAVHFLQTRFQFIVKQSLQSNMWNTLIPEQALIMSALMMYLSFEVAQYNTLMTEAV